MGDQVLIQLFQNAIEVLEALLLLVLLELHLLQGLLQEALLAADLLLLLYSLGVHLLDLVEDAVEEGHAAGDFVSIEDDVLHAVNGLCKVTYLFLESDEGLAIVGLLLHDRLDQFLQHLPHIILVLKEVDLTVVLDVNLELPRINHVVERDEGRRLSFLLWLGVLGLSRRIALTLVRSLGTLLALILMCRRALLLLGCLWALLCLGWIPL